MIVIMVPAALCVLVKFAVENRSISKGTGAANADVAKNRIKKFFFIMRIVA